MSSEGGVGASCGTIQYFTIMEKRGKNGQLDHDLKSLLIQKDLLTLGNDYSGNTILLANSMRGRISGVTVEKHNYI